MYRGRKGATPVTTACLEIAEGKTSYELSWKVKVMINIYSLVYIYTRYLIYIYKPYWYTDVVYNIIDQI